MKRVVHLTCEIELSNLEIAPECIKQLLLSISLKKETTTSIFLDRAF